MPPPLFCFFPHPALGKSGSKGKPLLDRFVNLVSAPFDRLIWPHPCNRVLVLILALHNSSSIRLVRTCAGRRGRHVPLHRRHPPPAVLQLEAVDVVGTVFVGVVPELDPLANINGGRLLADSLYLPTVASWVCSGAVVPFFLDSVECFI